MKLINRMNPHPIVLGDFLELWDEIVPLFKGQ